MEKAIPGPSNVREAEDYKTKLDELFEEFMITLRNDNKDALETTIKNVKTHIQGTWADMTGARVDVTVLTIKDPTCTLIREFIDQDLVTTLDPDEGCPQNHPQGTNPSSERRLYKLI